MSEKVTDQGVPVIEPMHVRFIDRTFVSCDLDLNFTLTLIHRIYLMSISADEFQNPFSHVRANERKLTDIRTVRLSYVLHRGIPSMNTHTENCFFIISLEMGTGVYIV